MPEGVLLAIDGNDVSIENLDRVVVADKVSNVDLDAVVDTVAIDLDAVSDVAGCFGGRLFRMMLLLLLHTLLLFHLLLLFRMIVVLLPLALHSV